MAPDLSKVTSGASRSTARPLSVGVALAVFAFLVYACTILTLPQVQNARYCCEQSSVAAAVSNVMYGARLGTLYSGVFGYFIDHFNDSLEQALEKARTPGNELSGKLGELYQTTRDGNGVGYPLVATAAFRLFGLHAWALLLTMLALMAFSASMFLLRFRGAAFIGVVILYFSALTVMLFTALVWDPSYAVQIAVGGIRYFSLVSVLPIFHILFELLDPRAMQRATRRRDVVLLGLQTMILVLTILVRGSALPLIGAIALVWLVLAWIHRRSRGRRRALFGQLAVMGLVSVAMLATIAVTVPRNYSTEGRFGTVIWQRVMQSLGVNPAWPFAGVNDMFDCKKYVPEGITSGMPDTNGVCIWYDYITRHNIPIESIGDKTFGSLFETAMREAFFKIAVRYPYDVLTAFVYYKPRYIVWSVAHSMRVNLHADRMMAVLPQGPALVPYSPLAIGLLATSLTIVLVFFSAGGTMTNSELLRIAAVTLLSVLFTIPSYLAAWAMPHTSGDLLFYCVFAAGLALGGMLIGMRRALWWNRAPAGAD